eukprot:gene464-1346_t
MIKPSTIYNLAVKFGDFALAKRFQTVLAYGIGDGERIVSIPPPEDDKRLFHPAIMDACFQGIGFVPGVSSAPIVPTNVGQLVVTTESGEVPREPLKAHVYVTRRTVLSVTAAVDVYTEDGVRVAAVRDFTMSAAAVTSDSSLRLLSVAKQTRRFPDLPSGCLDVEVPAAAAAEGDAAPPARWCGGDGAAAAPAADAGPPLPVLKLVAAARAA